MKLVSVKYVGVAYGGTRMEFVGTVEGDTGQLNILDDRLADANDLLEIKRTRSFLHSAVYVDPAPKEGTPSFRMTHTLDIVFIAPAGDVPEILINIAGNINHLLK